MKIAITGHRPNKLGNDYNLTSNLIRDIENRISEIILKYYPEDGTRPILISGMALGIDTLFAKMAIRLKLNFIAAIPCSNQDKMWVEKSKKLYNEIINHPLCEIHMVSGLTYNSTCMQERNKWMVDNCDVLIAVWNNTAGGTKNCIDYAKSINREIIYINPNDYK